MIVNTIYSAVQGEVNIFGIGHPVIFVRLAGCHLRCYAKTMGILCDTPEALEGHQGKDMSINEIVDKVEALSKQIGGVKLVCLSGGDPLYRDTEDLLELFERLGAFKYQVSVETSGTLPITDYTDFPHVHWVLDYKTKSAGIKAPFHNSNFSPLTSKDYIKFVIYDDADYEQFFALIEVIKNLSSATIAVGVYWNGKMTNEDLIKNLVRDQLLGKVVVNVQLHKLTTLYDKCLTEDAYLDSVEIPKEI